jgi:hypothetical protein
MDDAQALYSFWSGFDIPAYDVYSVPDDAKLPYITYNSASGDVRHVLNLYGIVWYSSWNDDNPGVILDDSNSWVEIEQKAAEINRNIGMDGVDIPIQGGTLHIARGTPPIQRYSQSDKDTKGIIINIQAKFITV